MIVQIKEIKYDLEGIKGFQHYVPEGVTKEEVLKGLPTSIHLDLTGVTEEEIISTVQSVLEEKTGWMVIEFTYQIDGHTHHYQELPMSVFLLQHVMPKIYSV